ncbi:MAG: GH36-type glycosyl hydrolase domain-containing protein [Gemmatimonadales bacterium]
MQVSLPLFFPSLAPLEDPIRSELFGVERLEQHAASLAAVQKITAGLAPQRALLPRVEENGGVLRDANSAIAAALREERWITPAAEWLVDNFFVVDEQLREIRDDLPVGFYRELPSLAGGPLAGFPRVYGIAWAYVAHTDSRFDPDSLRRFVQAYQKVQPLTIGELWALTISLRVVLVENLRRIADAIVRGRDARREADALADEFLGLGGRATPGLAAVTARNDNPRLVTAFAVELVQRLRDQDPAVTPALTWLNQRLAAQRTTADEIALVEHQRQAAMTVTVRNVITSMRLMSALDWTAFFEDVSLVDRELRARSDFAAMDFASRDDYRHAIEALARGSGRAELDVTRHALACAGRMRAQSAEGSHAREADPGFYLVGAGRRDFERTLGFRQPAILRLRRALTDGATPVYLGALLLLTAAILAVPMRVAAGRTELAGLIVLGVLALVPASDLAVALLNRLITAVVAPALLPRLEWPGGVPEVARTLVAVPTLLASLADVEAQLERLEVHYLANPDGDVRFALVSDWVDAPAETTDGDAAILTAVRAGIARLNSGHGPAPDGGARFYVFHRRRVWNPGEQVWMGWERKRGKLHELNRLLRGANTTFLTENGIGPVPPSGVRYVVTLDADTRLPIGAIHRLVGTMAHPLNRPRVDARTGRVVEGYAVLQPRVTAPLPGRAGSTFQRLFSGRSGVDPYAAAVSDVYQDLFGEGSYIGKGIYDIDAFEESLAGRVPENTLLSHDLFEGLFARAGLVTDVELFESAPANYLVGAARHHRWARGDWQLLPWIMRERLPVVARWKMIDNLRRTLSMPAAFLILLSGWAWPGAGPLLWPAFIFTVILVPAMVAPLAGLVPRTSGISKRSHIRAVARDFRAACGQVAFTIVIMAHQASLMTDAVTRTLARLYVTHRRMLEWQTTEFSATRVPDTLRGFYRSMAGGTLFAAMAAALVAWRRPNAWPVTLPLIAVWLLAPAIARRASRAGTAMRVAPLSPAERRALELIARRTWSFFTTFVTAESNHLPPDNFQETPQAVIAQRTSPTNIGLYLLATVAAYDFAWIAAHELTDRVEATLRTIRTLENHRGHLFNWYDTHDLRALEPKYVSSVDSGNLVGALITLASALRELAGGPAAGDATLATRLRALAADALGMVAATEFGFLFDPTRLLFSIGYRAADGSLDDGRYDLLASEARLLSFIAIAKGDVPMRHWFRLGRLLTPAGRDSVLMSWSGSMFEYLMPGLLMRAPVGSLLEQTCRLAIRRHIEYAGERGVPWGMSESGYNVRDLGMTYQYSGFGVPGLGLRRGLSDDVVVAPYATALAAMYEPRDALRNFAALTAAGADGQHGFYESVDYTPKRLPAGKTLEVVRMYMAHHQGMTIVAIANALNAGAMRTRFHAEPMIRASELLLQERTPRDVAVARPRVDAAASRGDVRELVAPHTRHFSSPHSPVPRTQLLSNGRYAVMVTASGSGYSRCHEMAVTRWREDATGDDTGAYIFLRDVAGGQSWSAGFQPSGAAPDSYDVSFAEDRAEFLRRDGAITTRLEVIVSSEDDAEVRRVSITNGSLRTRDIEVTSYAEVVLAPHAADVAHPAFSNLSIETESVARRDTLLASRRPRSDTDTEVWLAHVLARDGEAIGKLEWETDRGKFIGRGRTLRNPRALASDAALSNTAGEVLDPIVSLRRRVRIRPGKTVHLVFTTLVGSSRSAVLDLAEKYHDVTTFERVATLAWTQAQVQLHHLGITTDEAHLFQMLGGSILYVDRAFRAPAEVLARRPENVSALWALGISGDLPIVLVEIDDAEDIGIVRQLLRAHQYWRMKRLAVDLVILNDRAPSYLQDLQVLIETIVRTSQSMPRAEGSEAQGRVFTLRADRATAAQQDVLRSVARVELSSRRGTLAEQAGRVYRPESAAVAAQAPASVPHATTPEATGTAEPPAPLAALEFFNGLGGFDSAAREYVIVLRAGQRTPAPWINVIANAGFGCLVSESGAGCTWSLNSQENLLTAWSNDPVRDPPSETLYIRDDDSGVLWSPTPLPIRDESATYVVRHGHGYSRCAHDARGVALDLLQFVPADDSVKISRLTLTNHSPRVKRLTVTGYLEWVLGTSRSATAPFVATEMDAETGAMFARNTWSRDFGDRVAFADMGGVQTAWTGDRTEFLGRNGAAGSPAALNRRDKLSGRTGAAFDPCCALQATLEIPAGATATIVWLVGQAETRDKARALIQRYRSDDLDARLRVVTDGWARVLGAVQVTTPDRALDLMLNQWLLYQTLACRLWARTAFYQSSGAYGFRDQLQDVMALAVARPDLTRAHIVRSAAHQFVEGDVQHWWHEPCDRGIRTRFSDDLLWLPYAVTGYLEVTADRAILDEMIPFMEGAVLNSGQLTSYFEPRVSGDRGTLFEHCARALDRSLAVGVHGLPLMGTGDWNDGMNRVGDQGRGESVWLAWFLQHVLAQWAPVAEARGETARAAAWTSHAAAIATAVDREAWDGQWYRRAYFDDGSPLGHAGADACEIDSIAQSWSVMSGAGDPARARQAMASLDQRLVRRDDQMILLLTPPFDHTALQPGYIKGYVPGVRENGAQYTHGAVWSVIAFAELGDGDKAHELLRMLNPVTHSSTPSDVERYRVEPYVSVGDVYSAAAHVGRGGWTWYSGSAGWLYRAGVEWVLGIRVRGARLMIDPCIPAAWPGFSATVRHGSARYDIVVENPNSVSRGVAALELDGAALADRAGVPLVDDGAAHRIRVILGAT